MTTGAVAIAAWIAAVAVIGCAEPSVVRVYEEGKPVEGRFISERAYALYAIGADAEARGNLGPALRMFEAAAVADPESAEVWTRVGALRCATGGDGAMDAFARAQKIDARYEPLYRERATCERRARRLDDALRDATAALDLDPDLDDDALLQAGILEDLGRGDDARRALVALTVRRPSSLRAWTARAELAKRQHDAAGARLADERVAKLTDESGSHVHTTALADLDDAIRMGDLTLARRRARELHLTATDVAVRAAALGAGRIARTQAELIVGADPSDASARIALAVAADLTHDDTTLDAALTGLSTGGTMTPPSPLARAIFAELLARRSGDDAARAFLGPSLPIGAAEDPLLTTIGRRLEARLAKTAASSSAPGHGAAF